MVTASSYANQNESVKDTRLPQKKEEEKTTNMARHYSGLAMHGEPKYDAKAAHLDYVNVSAPKGGILKMGATGGFDTVNPYSIKGVPAKGLGYIYDRLMARVWDEPFTLYPLIAQKAEVSADRSEITFFINPKARFHDGSQITADDLLFSFETLKQKGRPNMRRIYRSVEKAEKIDRLTVHFKLSANYDRETVMILAMMPVLSKKWWSGRDFEETLLEPPLTSGPYKISEINSPHDIVYERVKDYWAKDLFVNIGHNNFDKVIYDYYRDDTVALEAFKKGNLNLRREFDIGKWFNDYKNIDKNRITMFKAPHHRPERVKSFIFNMRRPALRDIRVRKALFLAFDSKWVGQNIYHGQLKRIKSFFPNSALDGSGEVSGDTIALLSKWKKDLPDSVFGETLDITDERPLRIKMREADRLLRKAGWVIKNGKRVRADKDANGNIYPDAGKDMSFEVILSDRQDEKIALSYAKNLEKLGIKLSIRFLDSANFQNRKNSYDYDILLFYWLNSLSPGTEQMIYWGCEAAKQPSSFNFSGICNPALDNMAKGIANAKTYDELKSYAHAIDRILLSQYIAVPLFYKGVDYVAYDKKIKHPDEIPLYGIVTETWWMEDRAK